GLGWWGLVAARMVWVGVTRVGLRPDIKIEALAIILTATAHGLEERAVVEGRDQIVDPSVTRSLLGLAACALLYSCEDHGDGRPLRQLVDDMERGFPVRQEED